MTGKVDIMQTPSGIRFGVLGTKGSSPSKKGAVDASHN